MSGKYVGIWETDDGAVETMNANSPLAIIMWVNNHANTSCKHGYILEDAEVTKDGTLDPGVPCGEITHTDSGLTFQKTTGDMGLLKLYTEVVQLIMKV